MSSWVGTARRRTVATLGLWLALAACSRSDGDAGPGDAPIATSGATTTTTGPSGTSTSGVAGTGDTATVGGPGMTGSASAGGAAGTGGASAEGGASGSGGAELDAALTDAPSSGSSSGDALDSDAKGPPSIDASRNDAGIPMVVAAGVRWIGRVDTANAGGPRFGWSGTGFVARFNGTSLAARLANAGPFVFKAVVDGMPQPALTATAGQGSYSLASGLAIGTHVVALYRQTEGSYGDSQLLGLTVGGGALLEPPPAPTRFIEVVGASVSCGYGDLGAPPCAFSFATQSHWDTYAAVAGRALGADVSTVAISGHGVYRNADGSTAETLPKVFDRILASSADPVWDFRVIPQVVVVNLGKNDLALGDPGPIFRDTYLAFTRTLRARYPKAFIVCATGPNLGEPAHAQQLAYVNAVVEARHGEGDTAIEVLDWPEQVAGQIGCDVHPNAAKQLSMGQELVAMVRAKLGW